MNDYTPHRNEGFTLAKLIILGVLLTLALIFGIKHYIRGNSEEAPPPAAEADPFKADNTIRSATPNPGYNPASRPESLGGGGSIEMFKQTNAGYAREAEAEAAAEDAPAAPEVKKATAAPAAAVKPAPKKAAATVIPRMQPAKGFGIPGENGTSPASLMPEGAGTPDISSIIQNATKEAQKKH